jgi:hypothetical protein
MADISLSGVDGVDITLACDKKATRKYFPHAIESAGEEPFAKITRKTIFAARDRRKATPFAAS